MNKIYLLGLLLFGYSLKAAVGCMDHSYHMTKPCDRKNLHYVRCECPCTRIINQKGICLDCRHIGNPNRGLANSLEQSDPIFR